MPRTLEARSYFRSTAADMHSSCGLWHSQTLLHVLLLAVACLSLLIHTLRLAS